MLLIQILVVGILDKYHHLMMHIEAEMALNEVVLVLEDEMGILGVIMDIRHNGTLVLHMDAWTISAS